MNPLRKAIFERLNGDATLTALLSEPDAIYHRLAPENAKPPYIVFRQQAGTREWAFQGGQLNWPIWAVLAIDRGGSASAAEAIDARVDDLLDNAELAVENSDFLFMRRQSDVNFDVGDSGEPLSHVGGMYKIAIEPA